MSITVADDDTTNNLMNLVWVNANDTAGTYTPTISAECWFNPGLQAFRASNFLGNLTGNLTDNTLCTSTGYFGLPIGPTASRTSQIGGIRYNSDTTYLEFYNGGWNILATTGRTTSTTSSSTPTPNSDTTDNYMLTALAANATFGAPTGSPVDGQRLTIRIKDNGTARTLAWNSSYRAGTDVALPTTTVVSKTMYVGFIYNSADSKWDTVASIGNI